MSIYNDFELQDLVDEFKLYFPRIADHAIKYEMRDYGQLLVCTNDDCKLIFDWYDKSILNVKEELIDTEEKVWRSYFSNKLNRLLIRSNMTQRDLSRLTDISEVTLSKYSRGLATPSAFNIRKLAKAFGVNPTELMDI